MTKYSFFSSQFKLLGHMFKYVSIKIDASKIKDVIEAKAPRNMSELGSRTI